jgi:hypothetical protein
VRYGKWVIVIFIGWWVIHDPGSAATAVQHLGGLATKAASSAAAVISSVL